MEWKRVSIDEVKRIVAHDLAVCDAQQLAAFESYRVEPYYAPITRYGNFDSVVVVARRGSEVVYWEDVEEGFNLSPMSVDGRILQHWCNQDELGLALNGWIEGRTRPPLCGPARSLRA